jgi:hypothetical protein
MLDPAQQVRRPHKFCREQRQTEPDDQESRSREDQQRSPHHQQRESDNDFRVAFHRGVAAAMDEMSGFSDNGAMESHHE